MSLVARSDSRRRGAAFSVAVTAVTSVSALGGIENEYFRDNAATFEPVAKWHYHHL